MLKLKKIISGMQTGADRGGLKAAKILGLETGGWVPKGCRTQEGRKPEYIKQFNLIETKEWTYHKRTELNVMNSDGTIRFYVDPTSAGEQLTLKFIRKHNKPYFDIVPVISLFDRAEVIQEFQQWISVFNIKILNVAGNSDKTVKETYPHFSIEQYVIHFLLEALGG